MEATSFLVKVFSPFEIFYEGEVTSLSASNSEGPFDVLAEHANFITLLSAGNLQIVTPFGPRELALERGILRVQNGRATVFANV